MGLLNALAVAVRFRVDLLEHALFAVRTVDFNNYPISSAISTGCSRTRTRRSSGFSYTIGTGDGQRPNVNGITWADPTYYDTVLGAGGFNVVNSWNMKPLILYTQAKSGGWLSQGWNYVPGYGRGRCLHRRRRAAAITYADDYLLNGTMSSYQTAHDILTFVAYMTTRQGKTYNFAWLGSDRDLSRGIRSTLSRRISNIASSITSAPAIPAASPDNSWFDPNSNTAQIINWPSPSAPARSCRRRSSRFTSTTCAMRTTPTSPPSTTARSTPPLPAGRPASRAGSRRPGPTARRRSAADDGRAIMAVSRGLLMMQKREAQVGTLSADELAFTQFLENEFNRLYRNVAAQNVSGWDSKLASMVLPALDDYYQLYYGSTEYGTFSFKLASNSNTPEVERRSPGAGEHHDHDRPAFEL